MVICWIEVLRIKQKTEKINNMDSAKAQLADKIKASSNILVTVSRDPSVDQLSALLGLALTLNKMGKHAAAVFSGSVPSTLEFLQPEETFEKNTDSLRDFIIALDKSKADKLRYKVEDNVVRIFITPYKTSISDADLEFSQGDFNVDVVVAIGVQQQENLDEAITAHGRILHDATIATINTVPGGELGSINWHDEHASSLSELVTELVQSLDTSLLDEQISTALLTGIVAETSRFSNEKTSSQTMSLSAALMSAGANQQLVATKLEEVHSPPQQPNDENGDKNDNDNDSGDNQGDSGPGSDDPKPDDGTIEIDHQDNDNTPPPSFDLPSPQPIEEAENLQQPEQPAEDDFPEVIIDEAPKVETTPPEPIGLSPGPKLMVDPPSMGGQLTANSVPEALDPAIDPLTVSENDTSQPTLLSREAEQPLPVLEPQTPAMMPPPPSWMQPVPAPVPTPAAPEPEPIPTPTPEPINIDAADAGQRTLTELEASVASPHLAAADSPDLGDARDEVSRALGSNTSAPAPQPIAALGAQPLGDSLHLDDTGLTASASTDSNDPAFVGPMLEDILGPQQPEPQVIDSTAPPPVPPPLPFKFGAS